MRHQVSRTWDLIWDNTGVAVPHIRPGMPAAAVASKDVVLLQVELGGETALQLFSDGYQRGIYPRNHLRDIARRKQKKLQII